MTDHFDHLYKSCAALNAYQAQQYANIQLSDIVRRSYGAQQATGISMLYYASLANQANSGPYNSASMNRKLAAAKHWLKENGK